MVGKNMIWELVWFSLGVIMMANMDGFCFIRPDLIIGKWYDGFHLSKRIALACFAIGMIGFNWWLLAFAGSAYVFQVIVYNWLWKTLTK